MFETFHIAIISLLPSIPNRYSIRSFGYTILTVETRYYILILETLHGLTFALLWSASVEYGKIHAPKDFTTTMQSIITTAYSAAGVGIGSLVGGYIMDKYGGRWMYRGSAALSLLVFFVHAAVLLFSRTCCVSSRKRDNDGDGDNVMYTPLEDDDVDRDDNHNA